MNLDNISNLKKLDTSLVSESIEALPKQIAQVLSDASKIKIPSAYKKINQVVVSGMGGSNLGARIVKAVFEEQLKTPLTITPGYTVPASVNNNTLFVLSSYSGNTEETLHTYPEAKKRKAKIIAISARGEKNKLQKLMSANNIPGYIFEHKHNPSNQPRLGLGYSIFGTLTLLNKVGLFKVSNAEIKTIIAKLEKWNKTLAISSPAKNNLAKKIAQSLNDKEPILISAEHLNGNVFAMRNQFCETSKNFASYLNLPDLNHFAMEGLTHPKSNKKDFVFLFFDSKLYHPRIQKRSQLTKQVIKKNGIQSIGINLKGETKLEQAFEVLQLGTWITYYLGMVNQVRPGDVPFVDWFKKQLG